MKKRKRAWWVYVLECRGGWLYTGISPDPEARFRAHRSGRGAAFMRLHPPRRILCLERVGDYAAALRREAQVKDLKKADKWRYAADPSRLPFPPAGAPLRLRRRK